MSKRILWPGLLILAVLFTGCSKKLFHFVVPLKKAVTYHIDKTGEFGAIERISAAEIRRALNVPEDGTVTGVDIESLSLRVRVLNGNQAKWIKASGYIINNGKLLYMFENKSVPTVGVDLPYVGINVLLADGIAKLAGQINNHVKKINDADIELGLTGNSDPAGQRILLDIDLKIVATVKYDQCVEVFDFIGGEPCK